MFSLFVQLVKKDNDDNRLLVYYSHLLNVIIVQASQLYRIRKNVIRIDKSFYRSADIFLNNVLKCRVDKKDTAFSCTASDTLQMFAGNCRDFVGKSECRDFKFMGIACIPAIPVIFKSPHSDFNVKIAGILTLQRYYGDSPHQMQGNHVIK